MKKTLNYSLAALAGVALAKLAMSQMMPISDPPQTRTEPASASICYQDRFADGTNQILTVRGNVARALVGWLTIVAANGRDWQRDGFDPSYTVIMSDYKPMVRKLADGRWQIQFTSEIAEDIP